jgi:hypothetical protein
MMGEGHVDGVRYGAMHDQRPAPPGFIDDIARWRKTVGTRAPMYHPLLEELVNLLESGTPDGKDLADRLNHAWKSRTFQIFYDRPLLFLAALRKDALAEGTSHPLWSVLAAPDPSPDAIARGTLLEALTRESFWQSVRTKFVQTNETSRAVAWLWPAHIIGCSQQLRPLGLVEAGTAAGLNLVTDQLPAPWTSSAGDPLPVARDISTFARLGIDAHPLDARTEEDATWLRACVWSGEGERLARLEAAITAFQRRPAAIERGDVTDVPQRLRALTAQRPERGVVLAFQTIVRDYLDERTRVEYERGMKSWLDDSPPASALWVELELDSADPQKGVPLIAHTRQADIVLGRTHFHPATIAVDLGAVEQLSSMFR